MTAIADQIELAEDTFEYILNEMDETAERLAADEEREIEEEKEAFAHYVCRVVGLSEEEIIDRTLELVNRVRQVFHNGRLDKMPLGAMGAPEDCPIALGINEGLSVRMDTIFVPASFSEKRITLLTEALGTRYISKEADRDEVLHNPANRNDKYQGYVLMPLVFRAFVRLFDTKGEDFLTDSLDEVTKGVLCDEKEV